jgi:hypothetical protein
VRRPDNGLVCTFQVQLEVAGPPRERFLPVEGLMMHVAA